MKFFLIFGLFSLFTFSCSNLSLSKNATKEGSFIINGGTFRSEAWGDKLVFKRQSWFYQLTLLMDVGYTPINQDSPFYNWFSVDEKKIVDSCPNFWISILYAYNSAKFSKRNLLNQLEGQGVKEYVLTTFSETLKLHPDFDSLNLQLYDVRGLCLQSQEQLPTINIPNFREIILKP